MLREKTHDFFMREALKEAQLAAQMDEIPVGAVIVVGNKIIARAHNQVERLSDPTAHAEILAITAATDFLKSKYLLGCTMYVTKEPCAMCGGAMYWAKVAGLVFGMSDPQKGYQALAPSVLHPSTKVLKNILEGDSHEILSDFFQKLRYTIF